LETADLNALTRPVHLCGQARQVNRIRYCAAGSIRIVLSGVTTFGNSELPAGYWFAFNMYAITSAFCCGVIVPGRSIGIVVRIRSNRSPSVSVFQLEPKVEPEGGAHERGRHVDSFQALTVAVGARLRVHRLAALRLLLRVDAFFHRTLSLGGDARRPDREQCNAQGSHLHR
jgi:hypothetical protein